MAKRVPMTASAFSHRRRFRPCGWVQGSVGWSPPVWERWPAGLWWGGVPFGGFGPGLDLGGLGDFGALGGAGDCALLGVLPLVHGPDLGVGGSFRDHDGGPEDESAIEVLGGLGFLPLRRHDCATKTKEIVTLAVRLRPLDLSDSGYVPEFEEDPDGANGGRVNPEDDRLLPCSPPPPPPLLRCRKPRRP